MKLRQFLILVVLTVLLIACDPYYSISITNKTSDSIRIFVKPTNSFMTEKEISKETSDGFNVYDLAPTEELKVGSAIAEIDNDIPFEEIKIVHKMDTIVAGNLEEIKNLFDKNVLGGLKTPYNVSIE
jgi:hypothetical protein